MKIINLINLANHILYEIDLIKTPFSLYIDGKPKNSTYLGSFISIVIFFVLYYSFFQSNMIRKKNPYIYEKIIQNSKSPTIKFDKDFQFMIAMVDFSRKSYLDKTMFSIEAKSYIQNGSNISTTLINTNICTKKILEEKDLEEIDIGKILCMEKAETSISGLYDENYFNSLQFSIRVCNNQTDGVECKSEREILDFLQDKYLAVFIPEYIFDVENYQSPYSISSKLIHRSIPINRKSINEISYKKIFFKNDENWIFNQEIKNEQEIFSINYEKEKFNDILSIMNHNTIEDPLNIISIQSSKDVKIISRKYQKLQEVLANLSGIANSLIFIGFLMTRLISQLKLISLINNSLSNPNEPTIKSLIKPFTINNNNLSNDIKIEMTVNLKNNEKEELKDQLKKPQKTKSFFSIFPNFIKFQILSYKIKGFNITIKEYFKSILTKVFLGDKNTNNYYFNAEAFYKEKIDILYILKKLQEFEYLKKIVLSPTQNNLFTYLINRSYLEKNGFDNLKYNDDHLNNYRLLLSKQPKNLIDINFLELLNKNIENYESLLKKSK